MERPKCIETCVVFSILIGSLQLRCACQTSEQLPVLSADGKQLTFSSSTVPNLPEIVQDAILGFLTGGANNKKQRIIDAVLKRGKTTSVPPATNAPTTNAPTTTSSPNLPTTAPLPSNPPPTTATPTTSGAPTTPPQTTPPQTSQPQTTPPQTTPPQTTQPQTTPPQTTPPQTTQTTVTPVTTITLAFTPNPATANSVFTAFGTVTISGGGSATGGTVQISDDGVTATGPVDASGNFAVPLTVPDAGVYRGTADFTPQGGGGLTASASAGLTVLGLTPTVTLSVTPNPAIVGTNVLVSGTVTGPNSIIGTGTVAIKVGPTVLGNVALANGAYTFQYSQASPGSFAVMASYAGGGPLSPGTAGPVTLNVFPNAAVTFTLSSQTATPNQQLSATGTVSMSTGMYNGLVSFTANGAPLVATVVLNTISGGFTATFNAPSMVNSYTIVATYAPAGSISPTGSFTDPTQLVVSSCAAPISGGLSVSAYVACGYGANAALTCWGSDTTQELSTKPSLNALAVSVAAPAACAINVNGGIACWGQTTPLAPVRQNVPTGQGYTGISVGDNAACAIGPGSSSALSCWGSSVTAELAPPAFIDFVGVSVNTYAACGLRAAGRIACFGNDTYSQVTNAPTGGTYIAVSVGYSVACALLISGGIQCWGNQVAFVPSLGGMVNTLLLSNAPSGNQFTAVSVGTTAACALTGGSSVTCWGINANNLLGGAPTGAANQCFKSVSVGLDAACALGTGNAVTCWGANSAILNQAPASL